MQLTERTLEQISDVKVSFRTSQLTARVGQKHEELLIIGFKSDQPVNHTDLSFMRAMQLAAAQIWSPLGIVLDLRELQYNGGDMMSALFCDPYRQPVTTVEKVFFERQGKRFPIVAVVGPQNKDKLETLVRLEMSSHTEMVLFESLEEAAAAVASQLQQADPPPSASNQRS
jgi:hypothetical protein